MYDIKIKNARLRGRGSELFEIGMQGSSIAAIEHELPGGGTQEIDADGHLVTESFVYGHLHLCKVYTLERAGQKALEEYQQNGMSNALDSIRSASEFKTQYDRHWIIENVRQACDLAVKHGVTHIRAFADVDSKGKLEGIAAVLQAKEEYAGKVDLQVVAFPQDGLIREPGTLALMEEALQMGADVCGGIPWIEYTKEDEQAHIDAVCQLAAEYDKDISMLLDDVNDAEERTLEMLCKKVIEMGWQGRVTAQHCRAMALYPENYFCKLTELVRRAGIGFVTDPHTGPLHLRVKDLLRAGLPGGLGQDDIADAYYPYGECNMLQVAFLASHLLWMTSFQDMEALYDMVTTSAARVLGLKNHVLRVGGDADLVILQDEDVYHAIWHHLPPAAVIKGGKLVVDKRFCNACPQRRNV